MKTHVIQEIIKNKGQERGVLHILETHNEQLKSQQSQINEMGQMLNKMIDTLQNVVEGAAGMKAELIKRFKEAGVGRDEDDQDPNTLSLGRPQ